MNQQNSVVPKENNGLPLFRTTFLKDLHKNYIKSLDSKKDSFEYWVTEHLRLNGVYWGLCAMEVMNALDEMDKDKVVSFVLSCKDISGGFGGNQFHDPHLLYTLSAVQVLAMFDSLDVIDRDATVNFVASLQQPDGSFTGDKWGEVDTRFSYCAVCCLAILGRLDAINSEKAIEFVLSCKNFDGGFGCVPGAESHAGQIFTCVGALSILGALEKVDADLLGWWLCERQLKCGGLNGRPEKLEDVCYSWWVLSSLAMIERLHWIDGHKLKEFVLSCQDEDNGGIADRPGDMADVFHTFFGVASLSLLGFQDLETIDPSFALCSRTLKRLGIAVPSRSKKA